MRILSPVTASTQMYAIMIACSVAAACLPRAAGARSMLPVERYQEMDIVERRYYDRALALLNKKQHKAAAAEFEKMQVQFPECPALPYVILYRGLSLQGATYRMKAIEVYREVLDYFPTDVDPATKALHQIAVAYRENGDTKLSLKALEELDSDERYRNHGLAAPAIRALADHDYQEKKTARALERWSDVFARFRERDTAQATYCRDRVANHYLSHGQVDTYLEWLTPQAAADAKIEDPELARELWLATYTGDLIWQGMAGNRWRPADWSARRREAVIEAGDAFLRSQEEVYTRAGREWHYHVRRLRYAQRLLGGGDVLADAVRDAIAYNAAAQEKRERWANHERFIWIEIHYGSDPARFGEVVESALAYIKGGKTSAHQWKQYTKLMQTLLPVEKAGESVTAVIHAATEFAGSAAAKGMEWDCYSHLITTLMPRMGDSRTVQSLVAKARAFAKLQPTAGERDEKAVWLSDQLKTAEFYDQALQVLGDVSHKALRLFKTYEIYGPSKGEWNDAVELLLQVEATNDSHYEPLARETRAGVYKNHLKDYEKAIALYYEISDPPRTLWEIQDCYYRWQKFDDAITTLREIEAIFPAQASAAAWKRTQYYHKDKKRDNVIVEARRILKIYRKSRESSQAHQLLEQYGIATGGGVMDED